jgi:hypothetical protein
MKKNIVFSMAMMLLAMVVLGSCATSEERAARNAENAKKVKAALDSKTFKISVNRMNPMRGASKSVSYGYSVEVRNDSLISHLPYFGRAYNVPYGGGKGLNFKAQIRNYRATFAGNNGYIVECDVPNDEDVFYYRINIFNSGKAIIDVWARDRNPISFQGEMVF